MIWKLTVEVGHRSKRLQ